ncbi:MAG: Holliday junction branch migration protein RuvA [Muribaculaceae bacterium]|nr:Holliday junction branch migration protein RuvA [Muribaculaceae bacterium]
MIEYIRGQIAALTPASVTIETTGGIAYLLNISLQSYDALNGKESAKVMVHEVIREDAWTLYGFTEERERELFRYLIGVSGVGAATALILLSSLPGEELAAVISSGDARRLKAVKGIGAKTAERIIVDLRDKIKLADATLSISSHIVSAAHEEALAALTMLGFDRKASEKVLRQLFDADPQLKVETAIKKALTMM